MHRPARPDREGDYAPDQAQYDGSLPDERTRRVPRVDKRREPEVDPALDPAPATHVDVYPHPATSQVALRKAQQVVWYIFGVLETLLALRFILLAVGANPANPFFAFLIGATNPLAAPFANLVETPRLGASTLELGTVFAMIIYLLVAIALSKLLELALSRGDTY